VVPATPASFAAPIGLLFVIIATAAESEQQAAYGYGGTPGGNHVGSGDPMVARRVQAPKGHADSDGAAKNHECRKAVQDCSSVLVESD
jgi:hypothetical protein